MSFLIRLEQSSSLEFFSGSPFIEKIRSADLTTFFSSSHFLDSSIVWKATNAKPLLSPAIWLEWDKSK